MCEVVLTTRIQQRNALQADSLIPGSAAHDMHGPSSLLTYIMCYCAALAILHSTAAVAVAEPALFWALHVLVALLVQ